MTFIQCPGCGVATEDSKELCGKCGAALHEQAGPTFSPPGAMTDCPSCGAEISFLAKSCPHCGRRIDGSLTARHLLEGAVAKRQAGRPLSLGDKVNAGIGISYLVVQLIVAVLFIGFMALVVYSCVAP